MHPTTIGDSSSFDASGIEITQTETGAVYRLPPRDTSAYKSFALALIITAIIGFILSSSMAFGLGHGLGMVFVLGFLFEACLLGVGYRILKNRTRHEIELKDGLVHSREILFRNFGMSLTCRSRDIEQLESKSTRQAVTEIEWAPKAVAKWLADEESLCISAVGVDQRLLLFAPLYPRDVVEAVTKDLNGRLKSDPHRDAPIVANVKIEPTSKGAKYLLPVRDTSSLKMVTLILAAPVAFIGAFFALLILRGILESPTLIAILPAALVAAIPTAAFFVFGRFIWNVLTNQTRHVVELRGKQLISSEYLLGPIRYTRSCLIKDIRYFSLEMYKPRSTEKDKQVESPLRPTNLFYCGAQGDSKLQLALAPGYSRENLLAIANDLSQRINLPESTNAASHLNRTVDRNDQSNSVPVVDLSTTEAEENVQWTKPNNTRASVHETDEGTVFEYMNCNLLRDPRLLFLIYPLAFVVMILGVGASLIVDISPDWEMIVLAGWIAFLASGFAIAVNFLRKSTVRVAVMDGFLMIEESSKFYSRSFELTAHDIDRVVITDSTKSESPFELHIVTKDNRDFLMPKASRRELNWIVSEIKQRVIKTNASIVV